MGRRRCCWVTEAAGARREGCIQRMKVHICSCTAASTRRAHVGNRNKSFRLSFYSGECYFCTSIFDAEDVRFGLYVCRFITGPAVSLRFALRLRSSLSFPSVFNTAVSSPEHRNQKERPAVSIKFVLLLQTSLSFRLCASFCLYLCRFITGTQNQERRTSNRIQNLVLVPSVRLQILLSFRISFWNAEKEKDHCHFRHEIFRVKVASNRRSSVREADL